MLVFLFCSPGNRHECSPSSVPISGYGILSSHHQKLTELWRRLSLTLDPSLQPTRLPGASPVIQSSQQRITFAFTPTSHLRLIFSLLVAKSKCARGWLTIHQIRFPSLHAHSWSTPPSLPWHEAWSYDQVIWPDLTKEKWQGVMGPTARPNTQNCTILHSRFPQSASRMSVPKVTSKATC